MRVNPLLLYLLAFYLDHGYLGLLRARPFTFLDDAELEEGVDDVQRHVAHTSAGLFGDDRVQSLYYHREIQVTIFLEEI